MSFDDHKDFAYSTIPVGGAPFPPTTGASLKVASASDRSLFPTPPFRATVWPAGAVPLSTNAEIIQVNGTTGTDGFVVARAQESTTARSIQAGDQIAATVTTKPFTDLESSINSKTLITIGTTTGVDYLCDGIADDVQLQAVINAANTSDQKEIVLTSDLSLSTQVTLADNLTLNLNYHTIALADGANSKALTSSNGLENLTICNGTIDGNGSNQTSADYLVDLSGGTGELNEILLDNLYIKNSRKHMLFIHGDETGYHRKTVRNCTFDNHGSASVIGFGVYIDYAPNTTIEGCTFFNSNGNDVVEVGHLGHVRVSKCWFEDGDINFPFGDSSIFSDNIFLSGRIINDTNTANNVTISNNTIIASDPPSGYGAIRVHGANSRITGNYVYTDQNDGIRVQSGDGHVIKDNTVITDTITSTETGIHAGNSANIVIIEGNTIENFANATRVQWDDVSIINNTAINCTDGVELAPTASTGHVILNANILDNNFEDTITGLVTNSQTSFYGQVKRNVGINPDKRFSKGNITGNVTFDRINGDYQTATQTGNIVVYITSGSIIGDIITLDIITAGFSQIWPGNFMIAGGSLAMTGQSTVTARWNGTNWIEVSRTIATSNTSTSTSSTSTSSTSSSISTSSTSSSSSRSTSSTSISSTSRSTSSTSSSRSTSTSSTSTSTTVIVFG